MSDLPAADARRLLEEARSLLFRADTILTGPGGARVWHAMECLIDAVIRLEGERDGWIRTVASVVAQRDRLARILAVERGDQTQAPPGWTWTGREWSRSDSALEAMEAVDAADGVRDG